MKIRAKLIFGFLVVAIFVGIIGIVSIKISQQSLEKAIGGNNQLLAENILNQIDRDIYYKIEELQMYVKNSALINSLLSESNTEFDNMTDKSGLKIKDDEWIAAKANKTATPFMEELMANNLSQELRKLISFYENKYGRKVYGEVFIANKHGYNIGQTDGTSDYNQNDDPWWQTAYDHGLTVSDIAFDESAGVYSTDIIFRVNDDNGNAIGMVKAVLNIDEPRNIVEQAEKLSNNKSTKFVLLSGKNEVIYGQGLKSLEVISFARPLDNTGGYYFTNQKTRKNGSLVAYARSDGYRDFKSLNWHLLVQTNINEVLAPVNQLKKMILIFSAVLVILALLIGIFLASNISVPIKALKAAAESATNGNFNAKMPSAGRKDEIGELTASIEMLIAGLKPKSGKK